jgi:hypothetical protein
MNLERAAALIRAIRVFFDGSAVATGGSGGGGSAASDATLTASPDALDAD